SRQRFRRRLFGGRASSSAAIFRSVEGFGRSTILGRTELRSRDEELATAVAEAPAPAQVRWRKPMKYLLALDQGTSSSRSIVFDDTGRIVAQAQREFRQHYPRPGWVEHDPFEIWATQLDTAREALAAA